MDRNEALVRSFVDAENSRDYTRIEELLADDFSRQSAATPEVVVTNRGEMIAFLKQNTATFSDYHNTIELLVAGEDLVAVKATLEATMDGPLGDIPPTGKAVRAPFMAFFRIEDGKLADLWVEWDNVGFMSQLGLFPPPA